MIKTLTYKGPIVVEPNGNVIFRQQDGNPSLAEVLLTEFKKAYDGPMFYGMTITVEQPL